ncbi:flavin reductase family protein [Alicyclobacillus cycloheptanicus]|uniref:Flavin reductase (DIM6/NTAB) family NADH-FMN oxidoreductase RutF n=1 Tax=Alicyclobacillus cycloheptanicus TaxID=1457 RepID=A0ABT9XFT8_9BACL|nr:flavin reductase family protein [Alicyclobacillus cycloheptanicus]MDQ0189135.1 flavin reductase (DIM6/NTAB) family NADH-FMN oxidoreductase RutF [Alicyclobacillus cycloheptanicus]WDM00262.1 flavin reductase family protein [Alicyclobacillus cycloheptanicus]
MAEVLDGNTFRRAMGLFATGVTVITTEVNHEIHAMTANAFSSVSLHPPLILVCLNRGTKMERHLQHSARFAVNFLADDQERLSRHFAGGQGNDRAPDFSFSTFAGTPRLDGTLATVACAVHRVLDGGDHVIVLGQVQDIVIDESEPGPLLFWKGKYHNLDKPVAHM